MNQKLIKKNVKTKSTKKPKSNKVRLFTFFYIISFLMLLSGLVTFFTTFQNLQYYQYIARNYHVEKNPAKINQINQEYKSLLNALEAEEENFSILPASTTNFSFNNYLDNYWSNLKIYNSSVNEIYTNQDFLTFFINSYLNGDDSFGLTVNQLKEYKNLYSYTNTYYLLMNNQNEKYPSNDGYITSIFLITLAVLILVINLILTWKRLFRKTKKSKIKNENKKLELSTKK